MTAGVEEQADRERRRRPTPRRGAAAAPRAGAARRASSALHVFSSLTRRIIVLNLAALVVLVAGILYLNQFRAGLIDARVASLLTQGEIIAGAIAASATVDTDAITVDPDKLLDLQAGQSISPLDQPFEGTRLLDQSGAGRADPAPPDLADPHPRPHLRPRRHADPRFAPPLFARPDPRASTCRRRPTSEPSLVRARLAAVQPLAVERATCRSTRSSAAPTAAATRRSSAALGGAADAASCASTTAAS